jgi:O-antigen/teichoic acid export membrane protein
MIPIAQTSAFVIISIGSLWDLKRRIPEVFPTLVYWDRETARTILKPSLWFGSFTLNQFLLFESPVLILNQFAGKAAVVIFSLCRMYFGMVRQPLNVIRFSLRPEITRLVAVEDWGVLERAYRALISLSFSVALISAPLAVLAAPVLMPLWTKRSDMYEPHLYAALALATVLLIAKDCRLDLQYATNKHERSAAVCLISYGAYSLLGIPAVIFGGPVCLVLLWGAAEAVQILFVHAENKRLLPSLNLRDVSILAAGTSAALLVAVLLTSRPGYSGMLPVIGWMSALGAVLLMLSGTAFNLIGTTQALRRRMRHSTLATNIAVPGDVG